MRARRARRTERGQAVLVAVVGLVVLAIGMYTSYNLSRAVYEKIELQNAADAAAYSLATMEARSFNFIAMTNRAQVANYVQAMEAQSLLSNMTAVEGMAGYLGDWFLSLGNWLGTLSRAFPALQTFATLATSVGRALEAFYDDIARPAVASMERFVPNYIKLQTTKNWAMLAAAGLYVVATGLQVADGGAAIATANDPDAVPTPLSIALDGLNVASYVTAIDWEAVVSMAGDSDSAAARDAKRIMTEIANASRYSAVVKSRPSFIVSRDLFALLGEAVSMLSGLTGSNARGPSNLFGGANKMKEWLDGDPIGTTKLLQTDGSSADALAETGAKDAEHSDLAIGEAIVAKDLPMLIRMLPGNLAESGFFSVQSGAEHSRHCRYGDGREHRKPAGYGGNRLTAFVRWGGLMTTPRRYGLDPSNCETENDVDHTWQAFLAPHGGMSPYLPFAAKPSGLEVERSSFNQPDVWVMLNKPPSGMALGGPGDLKFELRRGALAGKVDAEIGGEGLLQSGLLRGVNVLARAQVYYHRPGAWREPPNLFNPYWGARLAPKNAAITGLASRLGVGGILAQLFADNVWMH
ncbi:MAG: hypothetical protein HY903_19640 [Deltaproteobacteria bacterium]|nr:hypothetical protein [Deltaproteobacteria bacterium]